MNASAVLTIGVVLLASLATADNAALSMGGLPRMLRGHPTVAMQSERVDMTTYLDHVDTKCVFTFANIGPACTVRMGFPDFGFGGYQPSKEHPRSCFTKYQSFVDGKPVKTALTVGAKSGEQWQVKDVKFGSHSPRTVTEMYTTRVGGAVLDIVIGNAFYLLHTGSSWKGAIGTGVVTVQFDKSAKVGPPLQLFVASSGMSKETYIGNVKKPGAVVAQGPGVPQLINNRIVFRFKDLKPTENNNILIAYRSRVPGKQ